ncbi:MAG: dehydrogenase [Planctomycetes bacterium]|nr:dehydrogenase [Planctomycetota bacterium]
MPTTVQRLPHLLLLCVLGGTSLPAADTRPMVQVAAGCTVDMVAGPPLVQRPVALALDEQGALYVTDSSGKSPRGKEVLNDTGNRVLRLVDDDGDGRYDRATVFADGLTFPEGCLWFDGSLYVGTTPTITRLTDGDGDGVAERRETWYDGKTLTGCANDLHGPYLGADGLMYWCKGAFDEQIHTVAGQPWRSRAAHIFRSRPDGSRFEPVMTGGMDNPVDVVQTSRGQRIFTTTFFQHPEAGRRDGLIHAVHGGVWGKDHDVLRGHRRTGDLMPVLTHVGAGAPCGLVVLESSAFGADAPDSLIACQFNLHKVSQHLLSDHGSTLRTRDRDLLWSSDIDFHPTDVIEDADGSLLIADTGAWYKICCPTSQLAKPDVLGAIYRVRSTSAVVPNDPRGLALDWSTGDPHILGQRLADVRPAVRQRAQQVLARQGARAVPALSALLDQAPTAATRRLALWTLARIDDVTARAAGRRGLADVDTSVREVACHVVALWSDADAGAALRPLLQHPHAGLRRVAVEASGRCSPATPEHLRAVVAALGPDSDRFLEHAVIFALQEMLLRLPPAAVEGLWSTWPSLDAAEGPSAWRALLIAVDQALPQHLAVERVLPLLDHSQTPVNEAARWIISHRPDWGAALTGHFSARLRDPKLDATARTQLQHLLTRLATAPHVSEFLAVAARDGDLPLPARVAVVKAMAEVSVSRTPSSWAQALADVFTSREPTLLAEALDAASRLPFRAGSDQVLADALSRVGRDTTLADALRVRALAAVPGGVGAIDQALFDLLTAHVQPQGAVATRAAAVRAIAGAALTAGQQRMLLATLATCGPLELGRLLPVYTRGTQTDEELGLALIATLRSAKAGPALRAEQIRTLAAVFPPVVQTAAQAWLTTLHQDAATQAARLDDLLTTLPAGDGRRGQEVFTSPRAACTTCHTIGYVGGRIGPDLTGIGKVRNRRDLLEAVIYPSASFVRSYEPWLITTADGQLHMGTISNEGPDFIVLTLVGGLTQRIARQDITEAKPSPVSLMPAGLETLLSAQELADLLVFLQERRG